MTRTSASIQTRTLLILAEGALKAKISKGALAIRCLKRLRKNQHKLKLVARDTIFYNVQACPCKIYFTVPEDVHNYVQFLRYMQKVSVSSLIDLAIRRYCAKIVRLLLRKRYSRRYCALLDQLFTSVHRKISFCERKIIGTRIVMLKPWDCTLANRP